MLSPDNTSLTDLSGISRFRSSEAFERSTPMQAALILVIALIALILYNRSKEPKPVVDQTQAPGSGLNPNQNPPEVPPPVITGGGSGQPPVTGAGSGSGTSGAGNGAGPGTSGAFPTPNLSTSNDPLDAAMRAQGATWKGVAPGVAPMYEIPTVNPGIHVIWTQQGYQVTQL
jgi:hypothetical protein